MMVVRMAINSPDSRCFGRVMQSLTSSYPKRFALDRNFLGSRLFMSNGERESGLSEFQLSGLELCCPAHNNPAAMAEVS